MPYRTSALRSLDYGSCGTFSRSQRYQSGCQFEILQQLPGASDSGSADPTQASTVGNNKHNQHFQPQTLSTKTLNLKPLHFCVLSAVTSPVNFPEVFGSFPKLRVPFWGPQNPGYSILWSMLGSPYFGKLPYLPH